MKTKKISNSQGNSGPNKQKQSWKCNNNNNN